MEPFVKIAERLSVEPALAEIARLSDNWVEVNPEPSRFIMILSRDGKERWLEAELPQTWRLIDRLVGIVAGAGTRRAAGFRAARPHPVGRVHAGPS